MPEAVFDSPVDDELEVGDDTSEGGDETGPVLDEDAALDSQIELDAGEDLFSD